MSFPEVSKRCPACGASARAGALFCPQCGRGLREGAPPADGAPASSGRQQPTSEKPPLNPFADSQNGGQTRNAEVSAAERLNLRASGENTMKASAPGAEALAGSEKDGGRPRASRQIGILAVEEKDGRGERLREASTSVLDEAADDPGLRFVLIAFVLFILFLAFLLLNSFVG